MTAKASYIASKLHHPMCTADATSVPVGLIFGLPAATRPVVDHASSYHVIGRSLIICTVYRLITDSLCCRSITFASAYAAHSRWMLMLRACLVPQECYLLVCCINTLRLG